MRIKNTSRFSYHFVRRMVTWACKEIGLDPKHLRKVRFTKAGGWCRGRAWDHGEILVRCGPDRPDYPMDWTHRGVELIVKDATAAAIYVTGHELQHIKNWTTRINGKLLDTVLRESHDLEPHCVRMGKKVMLAFEDNREKLLAEWNKEPYVRAAAEAPPKKDIVAERFKKAKYDLANWERKLKLAKTKVSKYRDKVRYYQRTINERVKNSENPATDIDTSTDPSV